MLPGPRIQFLQGGAADNATHYASRRARRPQRFKTDTHGGPTLQIGDWQLSWKVQGADTGYSFSVYETTLAPGRGLPLHKHPFPEFFYLLEGKLDFCRWSDAGVADWVTCGAGASVLAPPNAPHTFFNNSGEPARFSKRLHVPPRENAKGRSEPRRQDGLSAGAARPSGFRSIVQVDGEESGLCGCGPCLEFQRAA